MIRQWYLIVITLLMSVMIMKSINANSDEDDDDDDDDEDKDFDYEQYKEYHHDEHDYDDQDDYFNYKNYKKHQHDKHDHDDEGNCMTTTSDVCGPTIGIVPSLGITPTDGLSGPRICNGTLIDEAFYRFNAIFFGDFYTYGGQDILGPLAVKGDFHAPNYVVNANEGQDCSAKNSLESYGLVVGGSVRGTPYTQVHGSAYIAGNQGLDSLLELEPDCIVTGSKGTGLIDFVDLEEKAKDYSFGLAAQPPTLQLGPGGVVKRLGKTRNGIEFITFNSCKPSSLCESIWPGAMSDAEEAIFGQGNWNGVVGRQPDPYITYVFNIPVVETTTITINTNQPTIGFNGCRVILNFYPIKATGGYGRYSAFTILRNTGSSLNGFVLAPYGNIRDGPTGNFAGTIVARSYTWAFTGGVEIHDYRAGGGDCDSFKGCTPKDTDSIECTNTLTLTETTTSISVSEQTTTLERTATEDHTITVEEATSIPYTTTVGSTIVAFFTTTAANTVITTKLDTLTTTEKDTTTATEENTVTTTEKDTTTTTKEVIITSPVTTTTLATTTTLETTTITSNILTLSETTTTTKFLVGTIITQSDTTYTEVNTETVTLFLPFTVTDTTIATETQVNLIYDTTTVLTTNLVTKLSTSTLTIETHLLSTDTVTVFGDTTTFTDCTTDNDGRNSITGGIQSKTGESQSTGGDHIVTSRTDNTHTYTHTHDENCGHDYHNYKKYQKNEDKGDEENDKYDYEE